MVYLYTVFKDLNEATRICRALVERKLIRCANVLPAGTSIYEWDGKIIESAETYAYLKTTKDAIPYIEDYLREHHSYTTFCLLAIEPSHVNQDYKDWIES